MGRAALIPDELTGGPFTVEEARLAGVSLTALRGRTWKRIATEIYCLADMELDPWLALAAWRRVLPPDSVFAGTTAAWMHGLDYYALSPVEILVPPNSGVRSRAGLIVRRAKLHHNEVAEVRAMPATSPHRTLRDICAHRIDVEALVALDMALRRRLTDGVTLAQYARATNGPGTARLRRVVGLARPAESPMETRLRWLFIQNGLPSPDVQVDLRGDGGKLLGRADLFYSSHRLVIEFDGRNHDRRLVSDDRRQNLLINAGYRILRFTTADLQDQPDVVLAQVRSALAVETHVWRQTGA